MLWSDFGWSVQGLHHTGITEELYKATQILRHGPEKINIVAVLLQTPVLPTAELREPLSHLLSPHEQVGTQPQPWKKAQIFISLDLGTWQPVFGFENNCWLNRNPLPNKQKENFSSSFLSVPGLEKSYFAGQISPWRIPAVDALVWLMPALMLPRTRNLWKLGDNPGCEGKGFSQVVKLTLNKIDR